MFSGTGNHGGDFRGFARPFFASAIAAIPATTLRHCVQPEQGTQALPCTEMDMAQTCSNTG